jgi:hypothetical protein
MPRLGSDIGIPGNGGADAINSIEWWNEKDEARAKGVERAVDQIEEDQCGWLEATLSHLRMYRNLAILGIGPYGYARADTSIGAPLSLNVVRSMVNAVHSRLIENRPKAYAQTSGATYKQKQVAEKITRYGTGLFYQTKVYQKMPQVALDLLVTGTGVMKTMERDGKVMNEHLFSPNLRVDTVEGMHRQPQNFYEIGHISKGRLIKMHPEKKDAIMELKPLDGESEHIASFVPSHRTTDVVRVIEAYHLASEEGADDGICVQAAGDIELDSFPWKHDWSPYTVGRWSTSNLGFYGMGLAEELKGIQVEINRLVRKIQHAFQIMANPYILASRGSNIAKGQITDIPGSVISYSGEKPQVMTPQTVHPEVFAHLDRLYERAYEIAGMGQRFATMNQNAKYESGRAQLIDNQQQDKRYASVQREWENMHMEIMDKSMKIAKSIPNYKVKVFGDESYEELNFQKDIGAKDEEYVMQLQPVSYFMGTTAEQINQAENLVAKGLVATPEEALEQIDAPDIKAMVRRNISPRKLIEKQVQGMLDGGPQVAPNPQQNLALAADLAQLMYNQAEENGYPPAALRKVRGYLIAATRQLNMANQGGQAAMGAAPPVQPMAPMPGAGQQPQGGMPSPGGAPGMAAA